MSRSSTVNSMPSSAGPSGRGPHMNKNFLVQCVAVDPSQEQHVAPLINHKVLTRWPKDNNFYEATITKADPEMRVAKQIQEKSCNALLLKLNKLDLSSRVLMQ